MNKKKSRQQKSAFPRLTKNRIIAYGIVAAAIAATGYFGWSALIPANGTAPVLAVPNNHSIKALYSNSGYHYVSLSSGSVKGMRTNGGGGIIDPTYVFAKGDLQALHVINEDYQTHSLHNLNIDEFNVHTKNLGFFESQTITFIPDKVGTFEYYCSIHPEMKGEITVKG